MIGRVDESGQTAQHGTLRDGRRRSVRTLFLVLAVLLTPALSRAQPGHSCADRGSARWVVHQTLLGVIEPVGMEHQLRAGACFPLRPTDDPFFTLNQVELGVLSYASPTYAYSGGYVQLTPLSLLTLRVEVSSLAYWPLGLEGAGYYGLGQPDAPRRSEDLPPDRATTASGWNVRGMAIVRARVPVGGLALVVLDALWVDRVELGPGPYYLNLQLDHVAARVDTALSNEAVLALEVPIDGGPLMRFGAYDATRWVDHSGALGHQLGALVQAVWARPIPEIASLELLVRGGGYTDHPVRVGPALLGWVAIGWDLGPV